MSRPGVEILPALPSWPESESFGAAWNDESPPGMVHVIPSMNMGGAERIVLDLAQDWARAGTAHTVVSLRASATAHQAPRGVHLLEVGHLSWSGRLATVAELALASGHPAVCHLTSTSEMQKLWAAGCRTVPVVHNATKGWREDPGNWDPAMTPLVVACGEHVEADIRRSGWTGPVRTIRHAIHQPRLLSGAEIAGFRASMGVGDAPLIGMIGRWCVQKRYSRAIRLLADLRARGIAAHLAVIGAHADEEGADCLQAVRRDATRLGVMPYFHALGGLQNAGRMASAFDVFLNTSLWEGVSIATMEAVACGVPVVASDVGGQREALGEQDRLLDTTAPDSVWVDAIAAALGERRVDVAGGGELQSHSVAQAPDMVAHMWPWTLATLTPDPAGAASSADLLFVTGNLDVGGAQRSLCNLAAELAQRPHPSHGRPLRITVAVCGPFGVPGFAEAAVAAGVRFLDLSAATSPTGPGGLRGRVGRILGLARSARPGALAFWNMDPETKVAVARIWGGMPFGARPEIWDVSPGPMLFSELDTVAPLARRLGSSTERYLAALDGFVSKHSGGLPMANPGRRDRIVPNGVPTAIALPDGEGPTVPLGWDPALAVVTVGRLTTSKRVDLLAPLARALARRVPGASLSVVGGVHRQNEQVAALLEDRPDNLFLLGPDHRAAGFLHRFASFHMVSTHQGSPNASLEAMAAGLPVVANPDGGTAEQVIEGVTGWLLEDHGSVEVYANNLAEAHACLLRDPALRQRMGAAARDRAQTVYSMAAMVDGYLEAFTPALLRVGAAEKE